MVGDGGGDGGVARCAHGPRAPQASSHMRLAALPGRSRWAGACDRLLHCSPATSFLTPSLQAPPYNVRPGDRVAISMRNYPEWPLAYVAVTAMGGGEA